MRAGLRDHGYFEGTDVLIEIRAADGDYEPLSELAAGLVRSKVNVLVAFGAKAASAAKGATTLSWVQFLPGAPVQTRACSNAGPLLLRHLSLVSSSQGIQPASVEPCSTQACDQIRAASHQLPDEAAPVVFCHQNSRPFVESEVPWRYPTVGISVCRRIRRIKRRFEAVSV